MVATVALGLASRRFPGLLPAALGKYPGDALWALMVFFGVSFIAPRAGTGRIAGLALAFCLAIEAFQLYRAPWIDAIRATTAGHLVLGSAFGGWDLLAYAAGVALGIGLDRGRGRASSG